MLVSGWERGALRSLLADALTKGTAEALCSLPIGRRAGEHAQGAMLSVVQTEIRSHVLCVGDTNPR